MTQIKTKFPQPVTLNEVQGRDLFQTPNYAVDLLIPFIPKHISYVWEPASGDGRIARRLLEKTDLDLYVSDIRESKQMPNEVRNFLTDGWPEIPFLGKGMIITNPPFSLKKQFYIRSRFHEVPFALLIPADYSRWIIDAVKEGAEKIVPERRIDFLTPNVVERINYFEGTDYVHIDEIPQSLLYMYSSSDFHSMWLTWGFELGRTETFVDLSVAQKRVNIR